MTFKEYVVDYAPEYCGVHPAFSRVVELIFDAEIDGEPAFHDSAFMTTRDRAQILAPYPGDLFREHILDVIELAICIHRQKEHDEDYKSRIEYLREQPLTPLEFGVVTAAWQI
jgi:hypothetical protein